MPKIFIRLLFIGIVAALGKHGKLSFREMPVKDHTLFHIKKKASVRIKYQGRAGNLVENGPEVKDAFAIGPTEPPELVKEGLSILRPVPCDELFLKIRFKFLEGFREF